MVIHFGFDPQARPASTIDAAALVPLISAGHPASTADPCSNADHALHPAIPPHNFPALCKPRRTGLRLSRRCIHFALHGSLDMSYFAQTQRKT